MTGERCSRRSFWVHVEAAAEQQRDRIIVVALGFLNPILQVDALPEQLRCFGVCATALLLHPVVLALHCVDFLLCHDLLPME